MRSDFSSNTLIDPQREAVKPLNTKPINTLFNSEPFKKELRVNMSNASGLKRGGDETGTLPHIGHRSSR